MTARLPALPEVRQILNSTISPAADVLGVQVKQASRAAVNATANVNNAGLQVLARGLEATVGGINQAQLQVCVCVCVNGLLDMSPTPSSACRALAALVWQYCESRLV